MEWCALLRSPTSPRAVKVPLETHLFDEGVAGRLFLRKGTLSIPFSQSACVMAVIWQVRGRRRIADPEGGWKVLKNFWKMKALNDSIYTTRSIHGLILRICHLRHRHGVARLNLHLRGVLKRLREIKGKHFENSKFHNFSVISLKFSSNN